MSVSNVRKKIALLSNERNQLENECLNIKQIMTRASIIQLYKYCNKGNCKCKKGERHGPFPYLTVVINGKTIQKYIGKTSDKELVNSLKRYKIFQNNLVKINKINKEIKNMWKEYRVYMVKEVEG